MKNIKKAIALVLASASLATVMVGATSCGKKIDGTYTVVVDSVSYFNNAEVKSDLAADPGKYVKLDKLYTYLNGNIAEKDGDNYVIKTSGTGVADFYTAKLDLSGSTYTLTKTIKVDTTAATYSSLGLPEDKTACMELVFSGSFTSEKETVTLAKPEKVTGNMTLAGAGAAYTRFASNFEEIDVSSADYDDIMYPGRFFNYFDSLYFVDTTKYEDMTVVVSTDTMTFSVQ